MKVILLKDIKGTGKRGDIINASDGHARNYLIPRGLAKEATSGNVNNLKAQKASEKKRQDKELEEAKELAERISKITLKFTSKAGEGGKLFGSITSKDIAAKLKKDHKINIDKRKIVLDSPIKELGSRFVDVKVYPEISGKMKVEVTVQ
ncbi:50S ribosomal protein L9 [Wukongibacter baidiensis]|uniref:50S ribosomal protein L9 n=1 Tax=Wukongibacter baidiensis TaxID=1723361 RepID=UPI003D7F753E